MKSLNARLNSAQLQLKNTVDQKAGLEPLVKKGYVTKSRILDLDNRIAELQAQVESTKASIVVAQHKQDEAGTGQQEMLPQRRADLAAQVAALQQGIAKTPEVEATLNALNRDYENLEAEYRLTKAKTTAATTGQEMEEDRQAERFEVLEQAVVPDEPTSPDRPRILLAGAFGSVARRRRVGHPDGDAEQEYPQLDGSRATATDPAAGDHSLCGHCRRAPQKQA